MATVSNIFGEQEEDEALEETRIRWSTLIFVPFNPVFKLVVMTTVVLKCFLGPIQSVFPVVYCWDVMDRNSYLAGIKFFYHYCCDPIYGIDSFLHIVHRQVTDESVKREYLPKSGIFLILDFASLIPFFRIFEPNDCPKAKLWPNVLSFSETLVMYRVVQYFKLLTTHSLFNLACGFMLLSFLSLNCIGCFWILLTYEGFCLKSATLPYPENMWYDWRTSVFHKFNETGEYHSVYFYGMAYVYTYILNANLDNFNPFTIAEHVGINILILIGYLVTIIVIMPKIVSEINLRNRRIASLYPVVQRLVEETKRRNPSQKAWQTVENYYNTMWVRRSGLIHTPEGLKVLLPRYLRIEIKQDLGWAIFQHSPTLRRVSISMKRYLCDRAFYQFKLPGEHFFAGPQSFTCTYYIKSGVVQILSEDDALTPVISVTGGTIFGDISFQVPPLNRKTVVKCLTYCEIIGISRNDYIKALHKFPSDRSNVLQSVKERMRHARSLNALKQQVPDMDRPDKEGIFWIKQRWWELSNHIANWKKKTKKEGGRCELPPEETNYHCAKYIGQLVLASEAQLLTKSIFINVTFPWILVPHSRFLYYWRRIVMVTVIFVLVFYPPYMNNRNLTKTGSVAVPVPPWFRFFQIVTDFVYATDIGLSIVTAQTRSDNLQVNFATTMFARFKCFNFYLDFLATLWIEYVTVVIGKPQYFQVAQYNRLLKIYILFTGEFTQTDLNLNPILNVLLSIILYRFTYLFIGGYTVYTLRIFDRRLTTNYFFGEKYCERIKKNVCDPGQRGPFAIFLSWLIETCVFSEHWPTSIMDLYVSMTFVYVGYFISQYCSTAFISAIYLKHRDIVNFQTFVSNLKSYYEYYKIHQDLLKRLDRYLTCHWKYYKGAEIMNPNILQNEPYEIFWKVQGEVAEKIISKSRAFHNADPKLIRDLAFASKFQILPRNATIFLFGGQCKNVTWIVHGYVKCEYHNEEGELVKSVYTSGTMLSTSSVFLGKASLRTYTASTDCEIFYIKISDFYKIIQQHSNEWSHIKSCITEFSPVFNKMFRAYMQKHKHYQKQLRERVFHSRRSTIAVKKLKTVHESTANRPTLPVEHDFWTEPESAFMRYWMLFRAIIVVLSIINATIQGGVGAVCRSKLVMFAAFCDCTSWIDITLKMFLAYYNNRGIVVYDKQKCMVHYLTRSFMLDFIGALPLPQIIDEVVTAQPIGMDYRLLLNTCCKFAHIYIVIGYLNYVADKPSVKTVYVLIFKWQLVLILSMFVATHFLMIFCVSYTFDNRGNLLKFHFLHETCWLPKIFESGTNKTADDIQHLHLMYVQSLNMVQSGFVGTNVGGFVVDRRNIGVGLVLVLLAIEFWYVMGYTLTLLILNSRGNTLFQHGVEQLRDFLKSERVEKAITERAVRHFTYWWLRTKGINIQNLTNERIGVVFRQDLSYYFFQRTFLAVDSLLKCGENVCRQLASYCTQSYMLPGEETVRELDMTSSIYIVHRGKIVILKNNEVIATLSKGSIFGQIHGTDARPVKISALSEDYADLLQMTSKKFQDHVDDDVRKQIRMNPTSKNDYMVCKTYVEEDPYDTIQYILRGRKAILLPWMTTFKEFRRGNWYYRWLLLNWFIEPVISTFIVFLLQTMKRRNMTKMFFCCGFLDIIFFINIIAEFFTVELVVVDKKCVNKRVGVQRFKKIGFYIDLISLIVPQITFVTNKECLYQLFKLLRLRNLYKFHANFCKSFKSKAAPIMLKLVILFLLVHGMTCCWMMASCVNEFAIPTDMSKDVLTFIAGDVDADEWVLPEKRVGGNCGCGRQVYETYLKKPVYVVPANWRHDYIIAVTYIILQFTSNSSTAIGPLILDQIYFEIVITYLMFWTDVWVKSLIISYIYTKYRELYQYDYEVSNIVTYLKHSGLSPVLLSGIRKYASLLWVRQSGKWLPELALQAPICLKEDLMSALFMHHLDSPPLFRELPMYFKRQLVSRVKRVVVFPGRCIVQEGDILPVIYFIHEGEVEKWYTDKNGEPKMMSMLATNGYFGQIPGLFPNFPYAFSYYSRTVVDFVYLHIHDWQDLLDGYPAIKRDLYNTAKQLKKDFSK